MVAVDKYLNHDKPIVLTDAGETVET